VWTQDPLIITNLKKNVEEEPPIPPPIIAILESSFTISAPLTKTKSSLSARSLDCVNKIVAPTKADDAVKYLMRPLISIFYLFSILNVEHSDLNVKTLSVILKLVLVFI